MKLMSITITSLRAAWCSASQCGHHDGRPKVGSPKSGSAPSGAYQPGFSQPLTSRNHARCAARRSCSGDSFAPRAVCICLSG